MSSEHAIADDAYYRQLCANAGIAMIGTDKEGRIQTWNAAATRVFGGSAENMIGTPASGVVPAELRESAQRMLEQAIDSGETNVIEFSHRDEQGALCELSGTISPIFLAENERVGAVICVGDISRRIALQARLHQTQKMASLGEMAGAVSHHFNNILGGIITSIDFANASDDPITKDRILKQTSESLSRAIVLVDGLLAFAEGDRRHEDLADFAEVLISLVDEFESSSKAAGITLVFDTPDLPTIEVPRRQVTTVLRNILQNAVDAMSGGGTLTIETTLGDNDVTTRICDTGCGFDEVAASRVFEPFWSTKRERVEGAQRTPGLGLAVAHGLIHMIGGTITAHSKVDQGSCFTITVPRHLGSPHG